MKIIFTALLFLFGLGIQLNAQSEDPEYYLEGIKAEMMKIENYTAEIEIEVDVDFIDMPVKTATLFYEAPDKVKFKSKDFLMIPKSGMGFYQRKLLEEDYSAIYIGTEVINGDTLAEIKVIPLGKKSEFILSNLWIHPETFQIGKIETFTKDKGQFAIYFHYPDNKQSLPDEMEIVFTIEKLKLPMKFMAQSLDLDEEEIEGDGPKDGRVYIRFSNYKINQEL